MGKPFLALTRASWMSSCATLGTTRGTGETGTAGTSGNSYGDPVSHTGPGVAGPGQRAKILDSGSADRVENMERFAAAVLELFRDVLDAGKR